MAPTGVRCGECKWWEENGDGSQRVCGCVEVESAVKVTRRESNGGGGACAFPDDTDDDDVRHAAFPDEDDDGDDEMKAMPWRDLRKFTWYRIVNVVSIRTANGPARVLKLEDKENNLFRVWATKIIAEKMDEKLRERGNGGTLFIKPKDLKKCTAGNQSYYAHSWKIVR